jgi:hypothetical protein
MSLYRHAREMDVRCPARPGLASLALAVSIAVFCHAVSATEALSADSGRQGGRRPEILSGTFSGMVVTLSVPPQTVQSWLPDGLHLAPKCPFHDHPVIVLFGSIDDLTREKVVTVKPRFGRHYLETFVAVPYLTLDPSAQAAPVFHFVRLYSDSARGTTIGIRQYGWPKIYTPMTTSERKYQISREGLGTVLEAEMDCAHSKPVGLTNPSLKQIQEMLAQPMVLKHNGSYQYYSFNFHFETASLMSVPVDLDLREGFMPQLGPLTGKVPGIAENDLGAFYVECRYTKAPLDWQPRR